MALASAYQIGATQETLATLESLGFTDPFPYYAEDEAQEVQADFHLRNLGLPVVVWHWGFLSMVNRHILRSFFGTAYSAEFYIETLVNEEDEETDSDAWMQFRVIAYWTRGEKQDTHRRPDVNIRCMVLEDVTPDPEPAP